MAGELSSFNAHPKTSNFEGKGEYFAVSDSGQDRVDAGRTSDQRREDSGAFHIRDVDFRRSLAFFCCSSPLRNERIQPGRSVLHSAAFGLSRELSLLKAE